MVRTTFRLSALALLVAILALVTACSSPPPQTTQPAAPTQAAAKAQPAAPTQAPAAQPAATTQAAAPAQPPAAKPAAPVAGGTLTVGYVPSTTHIDVNSVNTFSLNEVAQYMYETLFDRDGSGQLKPLLVKEEQVSSDGTTVTWKLQSGVKFHDGSPFNAQAVKWNLERKRDKKQPLFDLLPITAIDAVDDTTVKVTLSRPFPGLNAYLSSKTFSMYSPTFAQKVGDDALKQQASGTGPFTLAEFKPNEVVRLKKNPDYWQKGLPNLDEVVFKVIPDASTRATQLEAGDLDMALYLSFPDIDKLKNTKGFKLLQETGSQQYYIAFNNKRAPFTDVKVRQALNYAVDKEGIIKNVFLGYAKPAQSILVTPTIDGFTNAGGYPYDPAKAKQLLDEAGWKVGAGGIREKDGKPLSVQLLTRKGAASGDYDLAQLVQAMLKAVGVDCKLEVAESATFLQRLNRAGDPEYDMVNLAFGTFTGDADYVMSTFYRSDAIPPRYYNYAQYGNTDVDKLIDDGRKAVARADRDKAFADAQKKVVQDASVLMLFDVQQVAVVKDTVQGAYVERAGNNFPAKYASKTGK